MEKEYMWFKREEFFRVYNCPNCEGNMLKFDAVVHLEIFEDGEQIIDNPIKIDEDLFCQCLRCGYFGKMRDFKVKKEVKKESKKEDKGKFVRCCECKNLGSINGVSYCMPGDEDNINAYDKRRCDLFERKEDRERDASSTINKKGV